MILVTSVALYGQLYLTHQRRVKSSSDMDAKRVVREMVNAKSLFFHVQNYVHVVVNATDFPFKIFIELMCFSVCNFVNL